jgi:hypothetical protein
MNPISNTNSITALMARHLCGEPYLQKAILLYCLGTPTADVMAPLVKRAQQEREARGDVNVTAWRINRAKEMSLRSVNLRHKSGYSVRVSGIAHELRLCKMEDSLQKQSFLRTLGRHRETEFALQYLDLTSEAVGGTYSGVLMREYVQHMRRKGMEPTETLWARKSISLGGVSYARGRPTTATELHVADELSAALWSYYPDPNEDEDCFDFA